MNLHVNNTAGLSNSSIIYFTITNTNAPTVSITNPTNITYDSTTIPVALSSTSADADKYWYEIYFTNGTLKTANTTWTVAVDVTLLSAAYYLNAYMNDTAGLEDSAVVYFTVSVTVAIAEVGSPPLFIRVEREKIPAPVGILYWLFGASIVALFAMSFIWVTEEDEKNDYMKWIHNHKYILLYGDLLVLSLSVALLVISSLIF
jgi:hypothetical protein